jgi:hypothetical protein
LIDSVLLKVLTNITSASNQIVKDLRNQPSDPPFSRRKTQPIAGLESRLAQAGILNNALPEPKFVGTERTT